MKEKHQLHIVSVGTSILTNFIRNHPKIQLPPISDDIAYSRVLKNRKTIEKIFDFVKQDPWSASAELNAMQEFLRNKEVSSIYLVGTETRQGKLTASVLKLYFKHKGIPTELAKPIPGYYTELKYSGHQIARENFTTGLERLCASLVRYIRKNRSEYDHIYINATGGFKPELAMLLFVGSVTNTRVYYRHEGFQESVFLPTLLLPVSRDISLLKRLAGKTRLYGEELDSLYRRYRQSFERLSNHFAVQIKPNPDGSPRSAKITPLGKVFLQAISET